MPLFQAAGSNGTYKGATTGTEVLLFEAEMKKMNYTSNLFGLQLHIALLIGRITVPVCNSNSQNLHSKLHGEGVQN